MVLLLFVIGSREVCDLNIALHEPHYTEFTRINAKGVRGCWRPEF